MIGKLYHCYLIDDSVFFGYLYQAITLGHTFEGSSDDNAQNLYRVRLILTLLNSLCVFRFQPSFYVYMNEYMSMLRCYLASKNDLGQELYELAFDVYKVI